MNIISRLFDRLLHISSILADTRVLMAARNSFILTLPFVLAGSLAVLVNNLPIPAYQNLMLGLFGETWRQLGGYIHSGTFAVLSVLVAFSMGYNMAVQHNQRAVHSRVSPLIVSVMSFACTIIIMRPVDNVDPLLWMSINGLFASMIVSITSSIIFIELCKVKVLQLNFFSEDADFSVMNAMTMLIPALLTITVFALIRTQTPDLYTVTRDLMQLPFKGLENSVFTAFLYATVIELLWFFGIHGGNVMDPVTQEIYSPTMTENIAAFAANEPVTNIFTKTFFDVFVFLGGSGATICLVAAILIFSKRVSTRKTAQISLLPALFNINELVVFGLPIVLNPFFLIPFVVGPVLMCASAYFFTYIGFIPPTHANVDWTTPPLINAYAATGSINAVLVQLFNIFIGIAIYLPFMRAYDLNKERHFEKVYRELVETSLNGADEVSQVRLMNREDDVGVAARTFANDLERAMLKGELFLVFQPQVNVVNGVYCVEALLRWNHKTYGAIPPPVIITVAEDAGMIDRLGLWIFEEALSTLAHWKEQGIKLRMAVNVSIRQLASNELPIRLNQMLVDKNIDPHELEVEVTEAIALSSSQGYNQVLQQIHDGGMKLAVDDFGMGHSSLLYLRQFHVDVLKVDASLSRDVLKDPNTAEIIGTIEALCRSLDIDMLVEFVDNEPQLEALLKLGARNFQGYLFSKPLMKEDVPKFFSKTKQKGFGVDKTLMDKYRY